MTFLIITISVLLQFTTLDAQAQSLNKTIQEAIITDPSISRRCESLIDKRKQKIKHRQRLRYLFERNKKLYKYAPKEKVSVKRKLTINKSSIIKELQLTQLQVQDLDESIIRRGCPGLSL